MDIRQGLSDFSLRLKEDRKTQVFAICAVIVVFFLMFSSGQSRRLAPDAQTSYSNSVVNIGETASDRAYEDLIKAYKSKADELEKELTELQAVNVKMQKDAEDTKVVMAGITKKLLERVSELENSISANSGNNNINAVGAKIEDPLPPQSGELEPFGTLDGPEEVLPPAEPQQERLAVIGEGDAVRVKLLAGVNAPTDGTPYPVVLELIDDITGPDGSSLNVGNARLVAAAQGSLADSRALFRLHTLNIRMPNGARQIVDVDGWIVGEDGKIGMEGILIDPIGKVLAGVLAAGTVEGVGEGLANSGTKVYTGDGIVAIKDGKLWKNATGEGLEDAADLWSDIVRERLNKLVPHVGILSGRTATAVFSKSQTIPGLYDALSEEEETFVALD